MSSRRLSLFPALLLGTALSSAALGADESIIVTATRLPKTAATSASMSSLTAEDLERRQNAFLVDALATLPGVVISQNGPFGGQASVRLRGATNEQTLVLLDGVAINDPTTPGGGYNFAFLDPAAVERVDVLRGPQSTLWGSDAIGGVVSIVTKRPEPGIGIGGFLEAGSFDTTRGGLSAWASSGVFDGRIGLSGIDTGGISKADARDGNTERDPYDSWTIDGRVGVDIGEAARLELFGRYSDSNAAFDSFGVATGIRDGDEISSTEESLVGAVGRFDLFDGRLQNILQVSRTEVERHNFTGGFPSFDATGRRDAFRYQGTLTVSDGIIAVFGVDHEKSEASGSGTDSSIDITGFFALAEIEIIDGLAISGGIRNDDHSQFGGVTTGSVGATWSPLDWLTLKANWSQGFKAPTIFQLTSFFPPAVAPNTGLQPEEAEGWDAGATVTFWEGRITIDAVYFSLETDNLIQFSGGRYLNVAQASSEGVEIEAAAEITDTLIFRASYTYTDAINTVTGIRLARVPQNAWFIELDWQASDAFQLGAQLRYNGEETDSIRPANRAGLIPDWTRLDFTASYEISDEVEIYGRVDNVTDEHYQDIFGYGTPGRSAYGGVRLRFE